MTKNSKTSSKANSKAKSKKQAGGTIVGLIIGLILGLGIAIGVAMVIYKTPLPFTNKAGTVDRAAPASNELSDPNKPLYGKKPPAKEPVAGAPAPTVAEETIKPPVVDKATAAKEKAQQKVEAAKAEAAKAESADEKWIYYLQAGAFGAMADAESMKAKLALMGFEATVSERQAETGTLHRVRIGPFGQLETMNRVRTKLSDNGVDVAVVRIGK
ncbi:SPOR domain-containing protein [Herminiimonas fonticola]|uniref:Sporulation related protein n=1 Tax=Herminiimonas fonticola TaxID=303380 RepID=A0A4R6GH13_9BURK|nr:SPOR domain-containing protein [Herminiimonas fonticola]RBA24483.1 Sporulation related domain [Herminiimonas fonticola]TDN93600.1 sporulation related protein [Herminiimonas fonticola]